MAKIKYKKLLLLVFTFIIAYIIFFNGNFAPIRIALLSLGYLGSFGAGIFFVYGFTAAPATAILLLLAKQQNIFLAGIIAGFGALIGDIIIFKLIRHSFADEIQELFKEKIFIQINSKIPHKLRNYVLPVLAGFIIASPLPDEIGLSLFAASKISMKAFSVLSYLLNTAGIFVILIIGSML